MGDIIIGNESFGVRFRDSNNNNRVDTGELAASCAINPEAESCDINPGQVAENLARMHITLRPGTQLTDNFLGRASLLAQRVLNEDTRQPHVSGIRRANAVRVNMVLDTSEMQIDEGLFTANPEYNALVVRYRNEITLLNTCIREGRMGDANAKIRNIQTLATRIGVHLPPNFVQAAIRDTRHNAQQRAYNTALEQADAAANAGNVEGVNNAVQQIVYQGGALGVSQSVMQTMYSDYYDKLLNSVQGQFINRPLRDGVPYTYSEINAVIVRINQFATLHGIEINNTKVTRIYQALALSFLNRIVTHMQHEAREFPRPSLNVYGLRASLLPEVAQIFGQGDVDRGNAIIDRFHPHILTHVLSVAYNLDVDAHLLEASENVEDASHVNASITAARNAITEAQSHRIIIPDISWRVSAIRERVGFWHAVWHNDIFSD